MQWKIFENCAVASWCLWDVKCEGGGQRSLVVFEIWRTAVINACPVLSCEK